MDKEKINKAIEEVREGLKAEGGDIEFIDIKDDVLYIRLTGACETCTMSALTLKNWVEKIVLEHLPELKGIKAV